MAVRNVDIPVFSANKLIVEVGFIFEIQQCGFSSGTSCFFPAQSCLQLFVRSLGSTVQNHGNMECVSGSKNIIDTAVRLGYFLG